jgi:SAM-dependent methyltransferase
MPAKLLIAQALHQNPNITCIDAGSSFDPIFVGNTRTEQASQEELKELYFESYEDPEIEGMMTKEELDWLYKTSKTVDTFLEIGSFKGKSTHAILSGGASSVYAVDHFVGSSDPIETGNNDTFADFIENVGHFKNLHVLQMNSLDASHQFEDKSLDVVFIDGGHRIQEITEDIVAWLPKAKKILCGHDYHDTKAVRLAVDTLLGPVQVCDRIWWKVLDSTEVLDMDKANKMARYLDHEFVDKMLALPQENHPEKLFVEPYIVGDVVYDLGCSRNKTIDRAIGVDIEPVTDIQASIDNLPMIATESVDTIISRHSIEHLSDCENALREWRRILKAGGRMILVVPDDEAINTLDPILSNGQHKQAFTRDSLVKLIESIPGLVVTTSTDVVKDWSFGLIVEKQASISPKMTFVIPTLGREEGLKRCLDSIEVLNYPKEQIEVIVKQDSFENRTGVPKLVKQGVEQSTGEWVVFASNDTEFAPDSIREALWEGNAGYVAFNTGEVSPDEGNINEHFMIRKDIIEKIGEVFDTEFYHCGCDNLLLAKMRKLGVFKRAARAVIKHYHFTKGAEMDKTYTLGWSKVEEDRLLLAKKLKELETI